jgi:hypothetical protein
MKVKGDVFHYAIGVITAKNSRLNPLQSLRIRALDQYQYNRKALPPAPTIDKKSPHLCGLSACLLKPEIRPLP